MTTAENPVPRQVDRAYLPGRPRIPLPEIHDVEMKSALSVHVPSPVPDFHRARPGRPIDIGPNPIGSDRYLFLEARRRSGRWGENEERREPDPDAGDQSGQGVLGREVSWGSPADSRTAARRQVSSLADP